jgi:hypothetical protein
VLVLDCYRHHSSGIKPVIYCTACVCRRIADILSDIRGLPSVHVPVANGDKSV